MHIRNLLYSLPYSQASFWLGISVGALFVLLLLFVAGLIAADRTTWFMLSLPTIAAIISLFYFLRRHSDTSTDAAPSRQDPQRKKALAEFALHSISEGVITTDTDLKITHMNPFACRLTGWLYENAIDQPLGKVLQIRHEATHDEIEGIVLACLHINSTVEIEGPALLISADAREYSVESSASPIEDSHGNIAGSVVIFRDVSHVRELSRKLEHQAKHDSLTNLINRREFEQQLKQAIKSARNENHIHTLCYMDLDQFKIVNDTCGHIAGDQLLRELSKLMPLSIRSSDVLARLGGDEFGVLMFDCPMNHALEIAEDLRTAISEFKFTWDKKIFDVGVSIGLVTIDDSSGSLQDILRRADASCYIAKDFGRNRIHVYTEDDQEHARRRGELQWLTRIHNALKEERFKLAIQAVKPIDDSNSNTHYEILLRMEDEEGKTVAPTSFLPAAERFDMMPVIDRWVITTSFNNIVRKKHPAINTVYNINLSGQTLRDDSILKFITEQISNYHIPPEQLCFEITETAAIANLGFAIELVSELRHLGCEFALDDFGSGLSSFAYLKKLPVNYLKIDGAFVCEAQNDRQDQAIVAAINTIGHEMGLKTVAEYVDNDQTLALMKKLGVNYAQGYAIDRPSAWS